MRRGRQASITGLLPLLVMLLTGSHGPAALASDQRPAALSQADSLWTAGHTRDAASALDAVIGAARARPDSSLLARALVMRGRHLVTSGRPRQAEAPLAEALALAEARDDTAALGPALRWIAASQDEAGEEAAQDAVWRRLLTTAAAAGDLDLEGWGRVGLGRLARGRGDEDAALRLFAAAESLFTRTGNLEGLARAREGTAAVTRARGDLDRTLAGYRANLADAREHDRPALECEALNNLGVEAYFRSQPDEALRFFQEAVAAGRRSGRPDVLVRPLQNVALCCNLLGRSDDERRALEESLAISERLDNWMLTRLALLSLAESHVNNGRLEEACRCFEDLLARHDPLDPLTRGDALLGLAMARRRMRDYDAAAARLEEAEAVLAVTGDQYRLSKVRGNLAMILMSTNRHAEAVPVLRRIVADARRTGVQDFLVDALSDLGRCFVMLDRPDSAVVSYGAAAEAWESERNLLTSPEWRAQRGARARWLFPDLVLLHWECGDPELAWSRLQAYKGRTLLERMLGPDDDASASLQAGVDDLVDLPSFQRAVLRPGELLLDYALGGRRSLLMAVTRDTCAVIELPARSVFARRVASFNAMFREPGLVSARAIEEVGRGVAQLLFGELSPLVVAAERVVVCPDAALQRVPFATLSVADRDSVVEPLWSRVPSSTVLARVRQASGAARPHRPWSILALTGDGPDSESVLMRAGDEGAWLGWRFAGAAHRHLSDADPADVGRELRGWDILHLAAHTENDEQRPWRSAVVFGAGDTRISAGAITEQDLDAQLVVLSSCGTADGRGLAGEGVEGLTAAFLAAGVPAAVSTLWPVDDAVTFDLVTSFYEELARGSDVVTALRDARHAIRSHPATAHPYYWAGFVVSGEGRVAPVLAGRARWQRLGAARLAVLGLALAGLLALVWRARR